MTNYVQVGQDRFQMKKCLGKMEDVAKGGRTVLFVSHNMGAIGLLCQKVLLLNEGKLVAIGGTKEIIDEYLDSFEKSTASQAGVSFLPDTSKRIQILSLRSLDHTGKPTTELDRTFPFRVTVEFEVREDTEEAQVELVLETLHGVIISHSSNADVTQEETARRIPGRYLAIAEYPGQLLNAGAYRVRGWIRRRNSTIVYDEVREGLVIRLHDYGSFAALGDAGRQRQGLLAIPLKWTTE